MILQFYNTLIREKEPFTPLEDSLVRLYSCGPTVYNYAHIGNLRSYLFMDTLRRVLQYNGYGLQHVMNITDVGHLVSDEDEGEDKMVVGARAAGKTPWEVAAFYTDAFMKDIEALDIECPEIIAKATAHIQDMIVFVEVLMDKGYGYETSDGIYFDIAKFPGYGKLSRLDLEAQQAGARVEVNEEKRNPADFALWKKAPPEHIMQWPSPWGMGYPGWHIECSAMARRYLGDVFDIHTGGVDHIPVHHENEIAQSEALLGHPAVHVWMHGEFMMVDNGKMSKSLGNTYTLADLADKGYKPVHFRYFCANAHYRSKLNFTWDGLVSAKVSHNRLAAAVQSHKDVDNPTDVSELQDQFDAALADDLNIPKALGLVWTAARLPKSHDVYKLLLRFDSVLRLHVDEVPEEETEILEPALMAKIEARQEARAQRNFAAADRLRDELAAAGIVLKDTPEGVKWERV